ncbi:hypothetical protein AYI70_g11285 [Smittium culicis]|uniref:Uncharacterized protein n=1 Tax=Smittium culicis TaxID=133412 RepID=A0A1R1X2J4_9FUNG|nr:hypothetical protein AYI70_g11285 [Smittium culicis]
MNDKDPYAIQLANYCQICHAPCLYIRQRVTPEEWKASSNPSSTNWLTGIIPHKFESHYGSHKHLDIAEINKSFRNSKDIKRLREIYGIKIFDIGGLYKEDQELTYMK